MFNRLYLFLANNKFILSILLMLGMSFLSADNALAHGVTTGDKGYIQESSGGTLILPFIYLGAKHMVTGYDHLLFLVGVLFFLYNTKHITKYVSLFALGHIITLLAGVFFNIQINAFIIDAIIGFSVVYKGLDNIGAFPRWFGFEPNKSVSTMVFGLFHGFGLATKLQEFELAREGLLVNLISFNVGVEIGQILALVAILIAMNFWRKTPSFWRHAYVANTALMTAGFVLMGYQMVGFFVTL